MLPQEFILQVIQANPIESVAGSYVQLSRSGSRLKCKCPFHPDGTPSCVLYPENNSFYCFGCHVGGSVITFIQNIESISFMEAVKMLAERAGMTVPEDDRSMAEARREEENRRRLLALNRAAAKYYYTQLTGADKRGILYLKERALLPETIRKYGLGYAGESWDGLREAMHAEGYTDEELLSANLCTRSARNGMLYDRFRKRVIFPIFDLKGSVIAFGGRTIEKDGEPKYLNSSDTPVFKKGLNLFSMNHARRSQSKRLILAEGYMDVIAMNQAGFENVVASLGTALTPEQCRLIRNQRFEEVIVSYDSDAAGRNAALKAINLLRAEGLQVRILRVENAKDPDEYLKKFGAAFFRKLIENAQDAVSYLLDRCKDGIDISEIGGRNIALQKAVKILSALDNKLERSTYISVLAKEYEISVTELNEAVEAQAGRRIRQQHRQEQQAVINKPLIRDTVNVDANGHQREATAEKWILCYLFRNPGMLEKIGEKLTPGDFVTSLNRRIYTVFRENAAAGLPPEQMVWSGDFSVPEAGYIAGITAEYDQIEMSEKSIEECVEILKRHRVFEQPADTLSDEDFSAQFARLAQSKRGET